MEEQSISLEKLSKKDKFHFIRVPKGFDIAQLNGIAFDPNQTVDIKAKTDKHGVVTTFQLDAVPCQSMDWSLLVKSGDKIQLGPDFKHYFVVTKKISLGPSDNTITGAKNFPFNEDSRNGLPDGLRERFTPFGSKCPESPRKKKKKEKKRKRSHTSPPRTEDQQQTLHNPEENGVEEATTSPKRKKKRKHNSTGGEEEEEEGEEAANHTEGDISLSLTSSDDLTTVVNKSHKKKKKKKDKD